MNRTRLFESFVLFLFTLFIISCTTDPKTDESSSKDNTLTIRQDQEPSRLNPLLSPTGYATQVYHMQLFQPLMEYNPKSLEYESVLLKEEPVVERINSGPYEGGLSFTMEILDEAVWDNGSPITARDYEFTLKAAFNPLVEANRWRAYLNFIKEVETFDDNPKKIKVTVYPNYMLGDYITTNFPIYPEYAYDPDGLMADVAYEDLVDAEKAQELAESNPNLQKFADQFSQMERSRDPEYIKGSGPYELTEWETGQRIVLTKKENWWGDQFVNERPLLSAHPEKITFVPIPDFTAALTKLKSEELDILSRIPADQIPELEKNELVTDNYELFVPSLNAIYWIPLNTKSPLLQDKRVRRAFAHLIDVDEAIEDFVNGLGERTVGPFLPNKKYYNDTLKAIPMSLDKAQELFTSAGWEDSNNNGTVDKMVDGKLTEMSVRFFMGPGSIVGNKIATVMKENAKKVGVNIEIIKKDFRTILSEHVRTRDYEMVALLASRDPVEYDPKQRYHSTSDRSDGSNFMGFGNAYSDQIIDEIRTTDDPERQLHLYRELQEIIYDEQPAIFLFIPKEGLAIHKRFDAFKTEMRPGYFAPMYQLKD